MFPDQCLGVFIVGGSDEVQKNHYCIPVGRQVRYPPGIDKEVLILQVATGHSMMIRWRTDVILDVSFIEIYGTRPDKLDPDCGQ